MTSSKFNGSLEPIRLSEESKNEFGFLQETWAISVQAFRLGFLFQVLSSDRIFVWDFFNPVLPSDPVIVSNVADFFKALALDVY